MVLFLLVLSMWHLWGITSKISVQYCQLVVIVSEIHLPETLKPSGQITRPE